MIERSEIEDRLRRVGAQDDAAVDVAHAALDLAALDRPGVALARYRDHLQRLAAEVAEAARGAADVDGRVAALKAVLFERHDYRGDTLTYDDMQNANLMRVIDRRKGLPVALGILCLHAARAQGWDMVGLNFPSHFLVRLASNGRRAILDPFHRGQVMDAGGLRALLKHLAGEGAELDRDHTRPVGNRAILLRLQNNIKTRALLNKDVTRAVGVLRGMVLFAPGYAPAWRELGYLLAHEDNLRDAIAALGRYIAIADDSRQRHAAAVYIQKLETRLN